MTRAALLLLLSGLVFAAPEGPGVTSGGAPVLPEAEVPAVAQDVGVAELPLLVTEPPEEEPASVPAPVTGDAEGSPNPFSPLILPETEAVPAQPPAATPAQPAPPEPITAVPVPLPRARLGGPTISTALPPQTQPSVVVAPGAGILKRTLKAPVVTKPAATARTPEVAETPVPETPTLAPAPQARVGTSALPGALSARMQPVPSAALSTGILERALATPSPEADNPLAQRAAVRAPAALTPLASGLARRGGSAVGVSFRTGLAPVGLAGDGNFTSSASNRVSRSLTELRVAFTAMTTGTGIFRVGDDPAPILVAVGERLPGTALVLSKLTSSDAQFSEDDARHTLLLNP